MKTAFGVALIVAFASSCAKSGGSAAPDAGVRQFKKTQDAGADAGPDAGPPSCAPDRQDCAAGESCLWVDGGVATACLAGTCDLIRQDCAAGQKCTYATDAGVTARACMTEGSGEEGQRCPSASDPNGCKKGLLCVDPSGDGGTGVCMRLCYSDSNCTAPATCEEVLALEGTRETPTLCVALTACDLFAQSCGAGQACYLGHRQPVCYPQGSVAVGGSCTFSSDCVKGAQCAGESGHGVCRQLCGTSGSPACSSGTCVPAQAPAPSGVGVCM
jgi:hypothetical protein